jgi:hypothetical protein
MYTILWLGNPIGKDHLEDLGIDKKIIIETILQENRVGWCRLGASGSG